MSLLFFSKFLPHIVDHKMILSIYPIPKPNLIIKVDLITRILNFRFEIHFKFNRPILISNQQKIFL